MRYHKVCFESFGCQIPDEAVSSAELESRLAPLYRRLRLPEGRLELITGVRERRFWPRGALPSTASIRSGEQAIAASGLDRSEIGALVHGSVCRDHLEPATACRVHRELGLSPSCMIYDVSNACLGMLNGIAQVANMIELGQIRAGLVVGTEDSRALVETTIEHLNSDLSLTRDQMKRAIASLTIGSASAAVLLTDRDQTSTGNRLLAGAVRAETEFHALCHSGQDEAVAGGMRPLMDTDSERLMREGIAVGRRAFDDLLGTLGWTPEDVDATFCHQVGIAHRKKMLETLRLEPSIDYATIEWLGNTGSVALPVTMALGEKDGRLRRGMRVAMLGIGSGINALMFGVDWQKTPSNGLPEGQQHNPADLSKATAEVGAAVR